MRRLLSTLFLVSCVTTAAQAQDLLGSTPIQEARVLYAQKAMADLFVECLSVCQLSDKERNSLQTALDVFRLSDGKIDFIHFVPSEKFPQPAKTDAAYTVLQTDRTLILLNREKLRETFKAELSHPYSSAQLVATALLEALTHLGPAGAAHLAFKIQALAEDKVTTLLQLGTARLYLVPTSDSTQELVAEDCTKMKRVTCAQDITGRCHPLRSLTISSMNLESKGRKLAVSFSGAAQFGSASSSRSVVGSVVYRRENMTEACFDLALDETSLVIGEK